jgi:hypothetical protein
MIEQYKYFFGRLKDIYCQEVMEIFNDVIDKVNTTIIIDHLFSFFIQKYISRLKVASTQTRLQNVRYSISVPWQTLREV